MIFLGGIIALSGVYMSSYAKNLGTYFFLYCIMNGIGGASMYFVVLICGWEWFPQNKGLISGLILGGYGIGAFFFSAISTLLVNPNNENPDIYDKDNDMTYFGPSVAFRVPHMMRMLALMWTVLVFLAFMMVKRKEDVVTENTEEQRTE